MKGRGHKHGLMGTRPSEGSSDHENVDPFPGSGYEQMMGGSLEERLTMLYEQHLAERAARFERRPPPGLLRRIVWRLQEAWQTFCYGREDRW